MRLKGHGKFGGKLTVGFLFSQAKNLPISLQRARGFKFQISWYGFFLKGPLLEPHTLAGVPSYDAEGSWEVWGKTDSWFRIQPRKKSANFVPASQRLQISNLMGCFFQKGTLVEPKTVAQV